MLVWYSASNLYKFMLEKPSTRERYDYSPLGVLPKEESVTPLEKLNKGIICLQTRCIRGCSTNTFVVKTLS